MKREHSFELISIPPLSRQLVWCLSCTTTIYGFHCYECQACGYIAHKKCRKQSQTECWDIPQNNDLNGNPIKAKYGTTIFRLGLISEPSLSFLEVLRTGNPKRIAYMTQQLSACNSGEINVQDSHGNTILHLAAMGEISEQLFRLALNCKPLDCNIQNKDGNTAMHYLCQYCTTPEAAELCDVLVRKGSHVNKQNSYGETPFHKSMFNKHVRFLLGETLVRHGANVNIQNRVGDTALHYAVRLNREDLVRFMLAHGAISLPGKDDMTPSQLAVEHNLFDIKRIIDGVQDVHDILDNLGLQMYEQSFVDEELKLPGVMSLLSPGRLEKLGVYDPIHKMKLLQNGPLRRIQKISPGAEHVLQKIVERNRSDKLNLRSDSWIIQHHELEYVKKLGEGGFAIVFHGIFLKAPVAIKVLHKEVCDKSIEFVKEFSIMSKIMSQNPSPRVIMLYGAVLEPRFSLVMELAGFGSLYQVLKNRRIDVDWTLFFKFCSQTCEGVRYLHNLNPPVLHRDLKPSNIMVTDTMDIKVGDFGMSKYSDDRNYSGIKGTPAYLAPEIIKGAGFSPKTDVYSMGVLIWEILYKCMLGEYMEPYGAIKANGLQVQGLQLLYKVAMDGIRPQLPMHTPKEIKYLLDRCLSNDPTFRPDFLELRERLQSAEDVYNSNKETWDALRQPPPPHSPSLSPSSYSSTALSSSNSSVSSLEDITSSSLSGISLSEI